MVEALRRDEPWRRALETVAASAGSPEALESIASEACGNWVWLTSFARRDAALDVGGQVSSMAAALSRHFRTVYHVEPSALLAEFAARRFAQDGLHNVLVARGSPEALPFHDAAFDCVSLHGPLPAAAGVLTECLRVLRPDGRIYVAFDNPLWYGRLADRGSWREQARGAITAVRSSGFRDVERYYAFPTFDRPRVLVPATRRACYARETVEARGTIRRPARRVAALVGLHAMLAPAVVIVARK